MKKRVYFIEKCESDNARDEGRILPTFCLCCAVSSRLIFQSDGARRGEERGEPNSWVSVLLHSARLI